LLDESFLALQVEDRIRTSRAEKELPPLNLPGPTGWWKKRNSRSGRNCFYESFLALQVGAIKRNCRAWKQLIP
jgi:hypothetical protein